MDSLKRGRNFAAWLSLVSRQYSSGGKERLGRISKAGQARLTSDIADHRRHVASDSAGPKVDPSGLMAGTPTSSQAPHAGRHRAGQQDGTGNLDNDDKAQRLSRSGASGFCMSGKDLM